MNENMAQITDFIMGMAMIGTITAVIVIVAVFLARKEATEAIVWEDAHNADTIRKSA